MLAPSMRLALFERLRIPFGNEKPHDNSAEPRHRVGCYPTAAVRHFRFSTNGRPALRMRPYLSMNAFFALVEWLHRALRPFVV